MRDAAKVLHPCLAAVSQLHVRGGRLGGAGLVLIALAAVDAGAARAAAAARLDAGTVLEVHRVGAPRAGYAAGAVVATGATVAPHGAGALAGVAVAVGAVGAGQPEQRNPARTNPYR